MRKNPARLAELRRSLILDSSAEKAYDDIARLLASSLDVPIAIVNFLDDERDWFKACIGFPVNESPASTSFCETFFHTPDDVIVVEDTRESPLFSNHPMVTAQPFVRFYAAARLTLDGHTLGTLCAYDMKPHKVSAEQIKQLQTLTLAVVELLEKRNKSLPG